jgi:MFS family permease
MSACFYWGATRRPVPCRSSGANTIYRPNVAPPVGPIVGGALVAKLGWKWIFWFLCILGGACLILIFVALPETSRAIVGNGSLPSKGIYRSFVPQLVEPRKLRAATSHGTCDGEMKTEFALPNPLASLKLLRHLDIATVVFCNGMYYMIYCCIQASLSTSFIEMYGYGSLEAGLIYIPFGVACLASTFIWGQSFK